MATLLFSDLPSLVPGVPYLSSCPPLLQRRFLSPPLSLPLSQDRPPAVSQLTSGEWEEKKLCFVFLMRSIEHLPLHWSECKVLCGTSLPVPDTVWTPEQLMFHTTHFVLTAMLIGFIALLSFSMFLSTVCVTHIL